MKVKSPISKQYPLKIVGGTEFGRYPKISVEQTFNMIISDNFLVDYAGYSFVKNLGSLGRGLFNSTRLGKMIAVIDNKVYTIDKSFITQLIGNLNTDAGDVFIDENDNSQIALCDKTAIYIYNYSTGVFSKPTLDFTPGYITFQDGYFIAPESGKPNWRLSAPNDGTSWPDITPGGSSNVGSFQTESDNVVACFRFPSRSSLLFVMGNIITEIWQDVGAQLFPYVKSTQYNIDYGCLNPATIAFGDKFVIWLGINAKSGPVILLSEGGLPNQISDEGWNFRFSQLNHPEISVGFLFKQDGHLIYQLTFYDPSDNFSLCYDLTTKKFFTLSDPYMNFHIARHVVFFNNNYYFVSISDGNLYEFSTQFTQQNNMEMPRIRVCPNLRLPDQSRNIINNLSFLLEQGDSETVQRIDLTVSKDGGETFSNAFSKTLNRLGKRQNRFNVWNLGQANDFVAQLRFWGQSRYVVGDGLLSVYQ